MASRTDSPTATVRLLVAHERNRELLREWLADTYEICTGVPDGEGDSATDDGDVTGTTGGDAAGAAIDGEADVASVFPATDLCLVDARGFADNRERLHEWKDRADPVFAPVVLVTDEPPGEGLDPESWESIDGLYVVDDVVQVPVEKAVLYRRLENLLSRRSLSSDLARSYERSEERFASLFHATPDPALVLSEGHVLYVNDAFCEQFGVDRDDAHWRHLRELEALSEPARRAIEDQVEEVLAASSEDGAADGRPGEEAGSGYRGPTEPESGPEPGVDPTDERSDTGAERETDEGSDATGGAGGVSRSTETVVVERADGEERYVETNVKPMILDDRRNVAVVMRDVTERRRRKGELERKNERLEEFASIVSHDLRNPIQVLDGRLRHLEERVGEDGGPGEGPEIAEQVEPMRRSVDRMSDLVEDMLTLAQQGTAVDETTVVDLVSVAAEAWTTTDAPEATLTVDSDLALAADPSRLRQLFENCFRNAVDHGPDDVTVRVGDLPGGSGFYIEDDGPGIPESERADVLELGHTTSDGGTGLGLGIVSEIVGAHDWEISVTESDEGGVSDERGESEARESDSSPGARFEIVIE